MIGLNMDEFYNALYYGADIDFKFGSFFYHINAGVEENGKYGITAYKFDKHPDEIPTFYDEIYNSFNINKTECVDSFLSAKLFDGKSIYDIEQSIEVLYS